MLFDRRQVLCVSSLPASPTLCTTEDFSDTARTSSYNINSASERLVHENSCPPCCSQTAYPASLSDVLVPKEDPNDHHETRQDSVNQL